MTHCRALANLPRALPRWCDRAGRQPIHLENPAPIGEIRGAAEVASTLQ